MEKVTYIIFELCLHNINFFCPKITEGILVVQSAERIVLFDRNTKNLGCIVVFESVVRDIKDPERLILL